MIMDVKPEQITLTLYDRTGTVIDTVCADKKHRL